MNLSDHFELACAAANRDPLTVRDLAEAVNHLQDFQDALMEFADNPPKELPLKAHFHGESFNRQFKDIDELANYIVHLWEVACQPHSQSQ